MAAIGALLSAHHGLGYLAPWQLSIWVEAMPEQAIHAIVHQAIHAGQFGAQPLLSRRLHLKRRDASGPFGRGFIRRGFVTPGTAPTSLVLAAEAAKVA